MFSFGLLRIGVAKHIYSNFCLTSCYLKTRALYPKLCANIHLSAICYFKQHKDSENEIAHKVMDNNINNRTMDDTCNLMTVFLYGTLKKDEPNHSELCVNDGKVNYIGKAKTVKRWPLVIASRFNIPYMLFEENKGKNVIGEVYHVNDVVLSALDKLECHPTYYERTIQEVEFLEPTHETKSCKAWIYFLKKHKPELLDLPCLEDYSSNGPHGLKYVESENTTNLDDVYQ